MISRLIILCTAVASLLPPIIRADGPGRIYTRPEASATGTMLGRVHAAVLTHAIAVERDRTRVYLGEIDADGAGFQFANLPVGRFDLVLVTKDNRVAEGIGLGPPAKLDADRAKNLETGVTKADSFFNRHLSHRSGVADGVALVFVERIRDKQILRGSGEKIDATLRRLEIIELHEADDEWQMRRTRHLFREFAPEVAGIPFLKHLHLPALGGLRLAGTRRDLGTIHLKSPQPDHP